MRLRVPRQVSLVSAVTALPVLTTTPAIAVEKVASCTAGGDYLVTTTYYQSSSSTSWFVDNHEFTITGNSTAHNNVYVRLRNQSGSTQYYSYTSPDNIRGNTGVPYPLDVNKTVPKSALPYMKTNAIFDQSGPDPNCSAYAYIR